MHWPSIVTNIPNHHQTQLKGVKKYFRQEPATIWNQNQLSMVKKATIDISDSCKSQPVIVVDPQSQRSVQPVCTCSGSTDEAGLQLLLTIFKFKFSHFKCLRKRKLAQKKLFKIEPSPTSSQCPTSTQGSPSLQTWSSNNRYQDYTITLFFFSHLQCLETILRQEVHSPIWIPVHLHLPLQQASAH